MFQAVLDILTGFVGQLIVAPLVHSFDMYTLSPMDCLMREYAVSLL